MREKKTKCFFFYHRLDFELIRSKLSIADHLRYALELVQGVHLLHAKGILHGDLNLKNVMFNGDVLCPSTQLKIIDFGLAKKFDLDVTFARRQFSPGKIPDQLTFRSLAKKDIFESNRMAKKDFFEVGQALFHMLKKKLTKLQNFQVSTSRDAK